MSVNKQKYNGLEVAVIGVSCKFPGADTPQKFWENIKSKTESLSFLTEEEIIELNISNAHEPNFVNSKGGELEDRYLFDNSFFNYSDLEAEIMDPQTRIMHECVWHGLEDSGYLPERINSPIGIYVGASSDFIWKIYNTLNARSKVLGDFESTLYTQRDYLHSRIAYNLNLKGPSILAQTTCSTSLVSIHLASRALLMGECKLAVAGGVRIDHSPKKGYMYEEGMFLSPDGHCRAFDENAKGIVQGEGAGVVVLKRLNDAINDKDNIYCIIKGTAINNDGNRKLGYTTPSLVGEQEVIKAALNFADASPDSISLIEAHGTGTNLGDLVEIEALSKAYNTANNCAIGSVKTNIGHLGEAAGIASFIKTAFALKNKMLPPSINFEKENSKIGFQNTPFYVNKDLIEWKSTNTPRRAGISSFGIGGTNSHIILEEYEESNDNIDSSSSRDFNIITISAKSDKSLNAYCENLAKYLNENKDIKLEDVAYTLQTGRDIFSNKKMMLVSNVGETVNLLEANNSRKVHTHFTEESNLQIIFMFPGQGNQYLNMGKELYEKEHVFQKEMDRCYRIVSNLTELNIENILYPENEKNDEESNINQIDISPIVNFIFEYALAKLLISRGVSPVAFIGHSIGEYVSACLSGVFSLEDAIKIIVVRGRLMKTLSSGVMMSVPLKRNEIQPFLNRDISLAADHGESCILSGPHEIMDRVEKKFKEMKLICQRLGISHAGHSNTMTSILDEFQLELESIVFNKPEVPYISTITGDWITHENATSPKYWAKHITGTVEFAKGAKTLTDNEDYIFVEVGAGNSLSTIVSQYLKDDKRKPIISTIKFPQQRTYKDTEYLFTSIGKIWMLGGEVNWDKFYGNEKRRKVSLPGYCFEQKEFNIDNKLLNDIVEHNFNSGNIALTNTNINDVDNWFYIPKWKQVVKGNIRFLENIENDCYLVFKDNIGIGDFLIAELESNNAKIIIVEKGDSFKQINLNHFLINSESENDISNLFKSLIESKNIPSHIVHLWSITNPGNAKLNIKRLNRSLSNGYYSLLAIAKEIGNNNIGSDISLNVITNNMHKVVGNDLLFPEHATIIGLIKIIPKEYKNIRCKNIDISIENNYRVNKLLIKQVLDDIYNDTSNFFISYRNNIKYHQFFDSLTIEDVEDKQLNLRENGVYLITGGLGFVGLSFTEYLVKKANAKVYLTCRRKIPNRENWQDYLLNNELTDPISCKIRKVLEIESFGGSVSIEEVDITDKNKMVDFCNRITKEHGEINGVINCALHTEGAIIHKMTKEVSERVFAPKISGPIILSESINLEKLDFFLLCSSQASIIGNEVSYSSANNFMDAYAHYISEQGVAATSINWCSWNAIYKPLDYLGHHISSSNQVIQEVSSFMINSHSVLSPDTELFTSTLCPQTHWVLDEHRINGKATLVGTAYIEMAYQAYKYMYKEKQVQFKEVYLLSPLELEDNEKVVVYILIKNWKNKSEFKILSNKNEEWKEHVNGTMKPLNKKPNLFDVNVLIKKSQSVNVPFNEDFINSNLKFGERWLNNFNKVYRHKNNEMVHFKLPKKYIKDLESYNLHPALFDCAGSYDTYKTGSDRYYLPFYYHEVNVYQSLSQDIFAYSSKENKFAESDRMIKVSKSILNTKGEELVEIIDYTLINALKENGYVARQNRLKSDCTNKIYDDEELHDKGISSSQGVDIFNRAINSYMPQLVVSDKDFNMTVNAYYERIVKQKDLVKDRKEIFETEFIREEVVSSVSDIEQEISAILTEILGVTDINSNDNFFEMGANSLTIVNLNNKLRQVLKKDISVVNIYTYPSISELSQFLVGENESDTEGRSEMNKSKRSRLLSRKERIEN